MIGGDVLDCRSFREPGVGDDDVKLALFGFHRFGYFAYVLEFREVSSDGGDITTDVSDCFVQLALTPGSDEDIRAFLHEPLGRGQADAAVAAGDEGDLSFEFLGAGAHVNGSFGTYVNAGKTPSRGLLYREV